MHYRKLLLAFVTLGIHPWLRARKLRRLRKLRRHPARITRLRTGSGHSGAGRREALGAAAASAAIAAGLAVAPPAHAISAGAIANIVTKQMKGMLSGLMGTFFQIFTQLFSQQTDKTMAAVGKAGDAINTQATNLENNRMNRESEPPPDTCRSDELGQTGTEASIEAAIQNVVDDMTLTNLHAGSTAREAVKIRRNRVKTRLKKYGPKSSEPNADISAAFLEKTQLDEKDDEATKHFTENVIGGAKHAAPALPEAFAKSESAVPYLDLSGTFHARRSVATKPLLRSRNRRLRKGSDNGSGDGQSEHDVLFEEVNRTWGSGTWRDELNAYQAPTPVAKEIAKLLSLQNKMLFKQLEMLEEGNLVLSTLLLESLDSEQWRERLNTAYAAAAGESEELKDA